MTRSPSLRQRWRPFKMMVQTLLGRPAGYFIPYRYIQQSPPPGTYNGLQGLFADARPQFQQMITAMAAHMPTFLSWGTPPAPQPRWQQGWYSGLDGASMYTMVRQHQPRRYVEIGSGHSTRFACQAIQDGALITQVTCIDPAPRAVLKTLPVTWHATPLQNAPLEPFHALTAGDMLIIDSSHIAMPGTDLDYLVTTLLPLLPPGVLIHFHDIFLPDAYPQHWRWRGYNEHILVATLLASHTCRLLWSSAYARRYMSAELAASTINQIPDDWPDLNSATWLHWRCESFSKQF